MIRLIWLVSATGVVGALGWLVFRSPLLAVETIVVGGEDRSSASAVVAEKGLVAGAPMVSVDVERITDALLSDPWVGSARVYRDWPRTVVIEVEERVPAATVWCSDGLAVAAKDGVILPTGDPASEPVGQIALTVTDCDRLFEDLSTRMALQFLAALPERISRSTVVTQTGEGMVANVAGYTVRLGAADRGLEKAQALLAVLENPPEKGSVITLIAPSRPAVLPPSTDISTTTAPEVSTTG